MKSKKVQHVTTEGVFAGQEFYAYDYLIVTTGSRYRECVFPAAPLDPAIASSFPSKVLSARVEKLESHHFALASAKKVLIIGAGKKLNTETTFLTL